MAEQEDDIFGGIFSITEDQIVGGDGFNEPGERNPDFYGPSLKNPKVKDKEYSSLIRFVPNVNDKNLQKISKWVYYLPDPDNSERSFYVDCLSNMGKKNNIITAAFFHLKEHDNFVMRQLAKRHFGRKRYHWSLVQIMMDNQDEDSVGKVKIFRFGNQVNDLIEKQGKSDEAIKKKAVIVYDPFKGKDFSLRINEKKIDENVSITNYEDSEFLDLSSMSLDGGETRVEDTKEGRMEIYNYLKENSPDLSQCVFQEWDEALEQKVIASVQSIIGDQSIFDAVYQKAYGTGKRFAGRKSQEDNESSTPVSDTKKPETAKVKAKKEEEEESLESKITKEKVESREIPEEEVPSGDFDDMSDFNFEDLP